MKITYDPEVDAAYIQLVDRIHPGEAARQVGTIATPGGRGEIVLDFTADDELLGIEILGARAILTGATLSRAEPPTTTA